MRILLAFAPFLVFAVIDRTIGVTEGLIAGALVSVGLLLRDWMITRQAPKILEAGTVVLFGGLALYAVLGQPDWSLMAVRLTVDAGLLIIVLVSMAVGKPFTLQYAREAVPAAQWGSPEFLRTNYVITGAWAAAFVVIVLADIALLFRPDIPPRFGIFATVLALVGALKFTNWYPKRARA